MVFGFGVLDRAQALEAMADAPPWSWFRIEEPRVVELGADAAALTYLATAQRDGEAEFSGRTTSVYVRSDGSWRLVLHQQTPAD